MTTAIRCKLQHSHDLPTGFVFVKLPTGWRFVGRDFEARSHEVFLDTPTGFVFVNATEAALHAALHRAQRLFADGPRWQQVMRRAMAQDFSWDEAAGRYVELYGRVTERLSR